MLRLCYLVHEKREDFARLRRAIGGCQESRLEIHLPGVADVVAVGERIAGDGVAQIAAELLFRSEDEGARGGMHAVGTDQEIEGLACAISERHLHRIPVRYHV